MQITRIRELDAEPAVTSGDRTVSYRELRELAGGLATELGDVGRAAVWAENTLQAIIATVATVESGVELVPLNPKLGSSELQHILSDARPDVVIGAPPSAELGTLPRIGVDLEARGELPGTGVREDGPAIVIYTSGTTGAPKGVLMPGRAIATNLDALAQHGTGPSATRSRTPCRSFTFTDSCSDCSGRSGAAVTCTIWSTSQRSLSPAR